MGINKRIYQSIMMFLLVAMVIALVVGSFIYVLTARSIQTTLQEIGVSATDLKDGTVDSQEVIQCARARLEFPFVLVAALAVLSVMLAAGIFTTSLSRHILEPLSQLKTAADHISAGDFNYRIDYQSPDEFGIVCNAYNDMQAHLQQSRSEVEAHEESRKELLAGISHDLRTPLTAIKGYVKGIEDGVASTPEKEKMYLDTIYNKAKDMEVLVEKLFLFSKLDTGKEIFNMRHVSAREYVQGYIDVVKPEMALKNEIVEGDIAVNPGVCLFVDCDQMSRVFSNILENAAKYKNKAVCHMNITGTTNGDVFTLCFNDDGPGVPEESLPKLFDSFYRADASRTSPQKGSGLGLAVAQRIVEAHGGTIRAKNNHGLCIVITLPVDKQKEIPVNAAPPAAKKEPAPKKAATPKKHTKGK